jgi:hypothetical protein
MRVVYGFIREMIFTTNPGPASTLYPAQRKDYNSINIPNPFK